VRLWSLVHKPSGRELLDVNPVFQPANPAIRNSWLIEGVEWNIGIIGHSPFTCSPLFAARVEWVDGRRSCACTSGSGFGKLPFASNPEICYTVIAIH